MADKRTLKRLEREMKRGERAARSYFELAQGTGGVEAGLSGAHKKLLGRVADLLTKTIEAVHLLLGEPRRGRKLVARAARATSTSKYERQNELRRTREVRKVAALKLIDQIIARTKRKMPAGEILQAMMAAKFDFEEYDLQPRPQGIAQILRRAPQYKQDPIGLWERLPDKETPKEKAKKAKEKPK